MALAPTFAVFAVVMVMRRAGEYPLARPGREILFTVVPPEAKYKAKNVTDTAAYRGADAASGWVKTGVDAIASSPAVVAVAGAVLALVSGVAGLVVGAPAEDAGRRRGSEGAELIAELSKAHGFFSGLRNTNPGAIS